MEIFFDASADSKLNGILLNEGESRHALKVLRYKPGEPIWILNGKGSLFRGEFSQTENDRIWVTSLEMVKNEVVSPLFSIAVSPLRKPDRNDFLLEKATELSVKSIYYFISQHTVKSGIRLERAEKVVLSALKQSGNLHLPVVHAPQPLNKVLEKVTDDKKLIASRDAHGAIPLWEAFVPGKSATLFIGPEGDFSDEEIRLAVSMGATPVWLGATRFRTETAAMYGLMVMQMMHMQKNKAY